MNYYEILGVRKNASQDEIKKAYKDLVKKYHPDVYKGDKTFAEKKTAQINGAYDVLSNPQAKQAYDEEISPKVNYAYTPPQYTRSYDEYKHKYTTSYQDTTKDGSEHDYSTYANYSRPYSKYHQSKTPNSNYNYADNSFTSKIYQNIDKLSNVNKKRIFILFIIFYLILLLYSFIQLQEYLISSNKEQTKTSTESTHIEPKNTTTPEESVSPNTSYLESENILSKNTVNLDSITQNINLHDYYTENELQQLYTQFQSTFGDDITYEEFQKYLKEYIASLHLYHSN